MHTTTLWLEAQKNMILDKIHHIEWDHPELSGEEKTEELWQLNFSLQLCEARIEKSKEEVWSLLG